MEKEMKKLLLVAVSVGVFLLVTITVALIVLAPRAQNESDLSSSIPYSQGRILPSPGTNDNIQTSTNIDDILSVDITEITPFVDTSDGENLTIHVSAPVSSAVSVSNVQINTVTAKTTTAAAPSAPKQSVSSGASASRTAAAAKPAPAKKINDYWIQIGAYRAMVRAEDARELLASNGLVSIIENREINGQSLYRVRLGPYTSEREANHWLAIVQNIEGFGESQVRQTVR